jgi:hypothetical protein
MQIGRLLLVFLVGALLLAGAVSADQRTASIRFRFSFPHGCSSFNLYLFHLSVFLIAYLMLHLRARIGFARAPKLHTCILHEIKQAHGCSFLPFLPCGGELNKDRHQPNMTPVTGSVCWLLRYSSSACSVRDTAKARHTRRRWTRKYCRD